MAVAGVVTAEWVAGPAVTYEMAMAMGALPTGMGLPAASVTVSTGVTVPSPWLAT